MGMLPCMKRVCLYALLAMGLAVWSAPLAFADPAEDTLTEDTPAEDTPAEDSSAEDTPAKDASAKDSSAAKKKSNELSPMAQALSKLKCYTKTKPNLKAKYYIFLVSTSTCAHCNRTMPGNVELYKQMRRKKDVELMLLTPTNMDNADAALGFLKKYRAPFAGATDAEMRAAGVPVAKDVNAPGTFPALPPCIIIADSEGNLVHQGPGSVEGRNMMEDWKTLTIGGDSAAEKKAAKAGKKKDKKKK